MTIYEIAAFFEDMIKNFFAQLERKIKQWIEDAVNEAIGRVKIEGLLRDSTKTPYQKTEELLKQYPVMKKASTPEARRVVEEIDACLEDAKNEPYVDVIRLYYFRRLKNAACAKELNCGERTARRYRTALVEQFSARLASDEFIRELLM